MIWKSLSRTRTYNLIDVGDSILLNLAVIPRFLTINLCIAVGAFERQKVPVPCVRASKEWVRGLLEMLSTRCMLLDVLVDLHQQMTYWPPAPPFNRDEANGAGTSR